MHTDKLEQNLLRLLYFSLPAPLTNSSLNSSQWYTCTGFPCHARW